MIVAAKPTIRSQLGDANLPRRQINDQDKQAQLSEDDVLAIG
jgi:hypothetical protein